MLKKILAGVLLFVLIFTLSGCETSFIGTEDLLVAPKPLGIYGEIDKALTKVAGENTTPVFPVSGLYRSAYILNDIEVSGIENYCLALYKTENAVIHMNILKRSGNKWESIGDNIVNAEQVEKVEFADISGDGVKEIIIGYQMFGEVDKQVAVYSVNGNKTSTSVFVSYNRFLITDLTRDGFNELFIANINTSDSTGTATLYSLKNNELSAIDSCQIDGSVSSISTATLSKLSNGTEAVFIDSNTSRGMLTDIVYYLNGKLYNPFCNPNTGRNTTLIRDNTDKVADINGDGVLDVPLITSLTDTPQSEGAGYLTNWQDFDGSKLFSVAHTVTNNLDGYYVVVPERFVDNIGIEKQIDNKLCIFYMWDRIAGKPLYELFRIKVENISSWDKQNNHGNYFELARDTNFCYTVSLAETKDTNYKVTENEIRTNFKLIG